MLSSDPADRPRPPSALRPQTWARTASRACAALLRTLYVGTALLGLLVTPPLVSLVLVPVLSGAAAVLLAGFLWYVQERWPARSTITTAALATAGLLPFVLAVQALQTVGDVVALSVLACLTVVLLDAVWTGAAPRGPAPAASRSDTDRLRELLQVLPVPQLLAQWRSVQHLRDTTSAAEVRALLLDELQRRDPDAFAAWLSSGAAGPPDEHFCHGTGSSG